MRFYIDFGPDLKECAYHRRLQTPCPHVLDIAEPQRRTRRSKLMFIWQKSIERRARSFRDVLRAYSARASNWSRSRPSLASSEGSDPEHKQGCELSSFRFMDLPPELRVLVYEHLVIDDKSHALDITAWRSFVPSPAIMAVSRQVRLESASLYIATLNRFWKDHDWYMHLTKELLCPSLRHEIIANLHAIPKAARVSRIRFTANYFDESTQQVHAVTIKALADDSRRVRWLFEPSTGLSFRLNDELRRWMLLLQYDAFIHKDEVTRHGSQGYILAGRCVETLLGESLTCVGRGYKFERFVSCLQD